MLSAAAALPPVARNVSAIKCPQRSSCPPMLSITRVCMRSAYTVCLGLMCKPPSGSHYVNECPHWFHKRSAAMPFANLKPLLYIISQRPIREEQTLPLPLPAPLHLPLSFPLPIPLPLPLSFSLPLSLSPSLARSCQGLMDIQYIKVFYLFIQW